MQTERLQTPVALFIFNRPGTTRLVFDAISKARPAKLLLIADGPRMNRKGEPEACRQAREIVTCVDWPCEVLIEFADENLGCQQRIISGLDWVFSLVEEAIILEDDCLPDPSFFYFCQELLKKYCGDARVGSISGTNLVEKYLNTTASYYFSQLGGIWGWATWRSAWLRYDRHLADWPTLKQGKILSEIFDEAKTVAYWTRIFDAMYENNGPSTWDYQWVYTNLKNNALTIVPSVNLIANIGFGPGATHTPGTDSRLTPPARNMKFPLKHPSSLVPLRSIDRHYQSLYGEPIIQRVKQKIRRIAGA